MADAPKKKRKSKRPESAVGEERPESIGHLAAAADVEEPLADKAPEPSAHTGSDTREGPAGPFNDTARSTADSADSDAAQPSERRPADVAQWPSSESVVVGRPGPEFEAVAVSSDFRPMPYRPDALLDGWSADWFAVRAASLRGHFHRYGGAPRQDDLALHHIQDRRQLVVAVADGVSSASQSHIGSTIAVRYAAQWLDASIAEPVENTDWKALAENTAWALVEQASALFGIEPNAELAEPLIATTLVAAVIEAQETGGALAHVVSIGDSGAWILSDEGISKIGGGKETSESGLSSSSVSGLPRIPAEVAAATAPLRPGEVLLVATDGFGDPLGAGTGEVGQLFRDAMGGGRIPSLFEFGHKLDFSRETFDDDRTLVAVWPTANDSAPMR